MGGGEHRRAGCGPPPPRGCCCRRPSHASGSCGLVRYSVLSPVGTADSTQLEAEHDDHHDRPGRPGGPRAAIARRGGRRDARRPARAGAPGRGEPRVGLGAARHPRHGSRRVLGHRAVAAGGVQRHGVRDHDGGRRGRPGGHARDDVGPADRTVRRLDAGRARVERVFVPTGRVVPGAPRPLPAACGTGRWWSTGRCATTRRWRSSSAGSRRRRRTCCGARSRPAARARAGARRAETAEGRTKGRHPPGAGPVVCRGAQMPSRRSSRTTVSPFCATGGATWG